MPNLILGLFLKKRIAQHFKKSPKQRKFASSGHTASESKKGALDEIDEQSLTNFLKPTIYYWLLQEGTND